MKIELLDCTLRDGGYINDWNFGEKNIECIINGLQESKVDFIELGYYTNTRKTTNNTALYSDIEQLDKKLKNKNNLLMINYSEVDIDKIPHKKKIENIIGIRVCFHKKNCNDALEYCQKIIDKGWNVFIQPMVTMSYSKQELIKLIEKVNEISPYAIYVADSFGTMNEKNVKEKFKFIDKILDSKIKLGFHSHNNLQLSYSNVKSFINLKLNRNIIIDCSIYGMGRGAGNLNTELITKFLNENYNKNYDINKILELVDKCIIPEKDKNNWGYCLEYYISAINNCHPNFAKYLASLHTLNIQDINYILKNISDDKKTHFDKNYIEELYYAYLNHYVDDKLSYEILKKKLNRQKILLLGGGPSLIRNKKSIMKAINKDTVVISLNNYIQDIECDYVFISNKRRYEELLDNIPSNKLVVTSNVSKKIPEDVLVFDYFCNISKKFETSDNVLLMLLNIFVKSGIKGVYLAGFDGFKLNRKNFYSDELSYQIDKERIKKVNSEMKKNLSSFSKSINIIWLTKSSYIMGGAK